MTDSSFLAISCPHCQGTAIIFPAERNCGIFRHGTFRNSENQPIPPHASKADIDHWLALGAIYGCGGPFRLEGDEAQACDYI